MLNTFQQQPHSVLPGHTADEASRQEFANSLKQFIQQDIRPGVGQVFGGRAAPCFEKDTGNPPAGRRDIRSAMVKDPYFQTYAAVNRIAQELLWDSVIDSIEREGEAWNDALEAASLVRVEVPGFHSDELSLQHCGRVFRKVVLVEVVTDTDEAFAHTGGAASLTGRELYERTTVDA